MGEPFLLLILFLSRILFVSPLPIYFDGPEYIRLISNPSLIHALTLGHEPIHPGFIVLSWIVNKISPWGPIYSTELLISVCSALGLFVFYKIVQILFSKEIAIRSLIVSSLLPVLWLLGINVMVDWVYILFYLLALYSFLKYVQGRKTGWFIISMFALEYSIFTHVQVIIWLPVFLGLLCLHKSNLKPTLKITLALLIFGTSLGLASLVILEMTAGTNFIVSIKSLFLHGGDFITSASVLHEVGIYTRNLGITLLRNNSSLIILGSILGGYILLKKDKRKLALLLLWIAPVLITSQYWHIGLFGRVSVIASLPIAILVAQIKSRVVFALLVCNLLIISVPLVIQNKNSTVQKELRALYQVVPKDSVLISSNLIRPQVTYTGQTYFINEPGQDINFIQSKVNLSLKTNKQVFIDSQALYNPYYSLDGNNLHILSLGKIGHSTIAPLFSMYQVRLVKIIDLKNRIFLYQVLSQKPYRQITYIYSYPSDFRYKMNPLRFDYYDVGTWAWYIIADKKDPMYWTTAYK